MISVGIVKPGKLVHHVYVTREVMSKYQNHESKGQDKSRYPFIHEN
jgi:hypothetical protein